MKVDIIRNGETITQEIEATDKRKHVFWEVTGKCNQHCVYCYGYKDRTMQLSFDELMGIAEVIKVSAFEVIHITGGEPMLVKDLDKIISYLAPKPVRLSTNMSIWNDTFERILECDNVTSIAISLDSIDPEANNKVRGNCDKIIANIERLMEYKRTHNVSFDVRMHAVLTTANIDNVEELLRWAKDLGVKEVSCQPVDMSSKETDDLSIPKEDFYKIEQVYALEKELFHNVYSDTELQWLRHFYAAGPTETIGLKCDGIICHPLIDSAGDFWDCPERKHMALKKTTDCELHIACTTCLKKIRLS